MTPAKNDRAEGGVPEWALEKAVSYINGCLSDGEMSTTAAKAATYPSAMAFAKYIAEHEEEPVDPLREVVKCAYDATTCHAFGYDLFIDTLTNELRQRGIELAREQGA